MEVMGQAQHFLNTLESAVYTEVLRFPRWVIGETVLSGTLADTG